jgi:hypothetical protein
MPIHERVQAESTPIRPTIRLLAGLTLLWSISAVNVLWIGSATIYSPEREAQRAMLHRAVLDGELPEGAASWSSLGANSIALRPGVPWLADKLSRSMHLDLGRSYQFIEFASVMLALAVLFGLLRRTLTLPMALIGCLYVSALLPLSYFMHYFHPWDKTSLALWLTAVVLLLADRVFTASLIIALAVVVKFDVVVIPMLYVLLFARAMHWRRFLPRLALLCGAAVIPFTALLMLRPAAEEPRDLVEQFTQNAQTFVDKWYMYPPLIGLALPMIMGAIGFRRASHDERALYVFAITIAAILFVTTNFIEIRAEFVPMALSLPCAAHGLDRFFDREPAGTIELSERMST